MRLPDKSDSVLADADHLQYPVCCCSCRRDHVHVRFKVELDGVLQRVDDDADGLHTH